MANWYSCRAFGSAGENQFRQKSALRTNGSIEKSFLVVLKGELKGPFKTRFVIKLQICIWIKLRTTELSSASKEITEHFCNLKVISRSVCFQHFVPKSIWIFYSAEIYYSDTGFSLLLWFFGLERHLPIFCDFIISNIHFDSFRFTWLFGKFFCHISNKHA